MNACNLFQVANVLPSKHKSVCSHCIRNQCVAPSKHHFGPARFLAGQDIFLYSSIPRLALGPSQPSVECTGGGASWAWSRPFTCIQCRGRTRGAAPAFVAVLN